MPEADWSKLSALVAERMGLHFPPERWGDLKRGLAAASRELGCADPAECVGFLLSRPLARRQLQVLASHLTIGETYFFRDTPLFQALSEHVLPDLIRNRRGRAKRLRIWSAASCTGEEPYSVAILLHQLLPDLHQWEVTVTATDINPQFLRKAAAGVYREWSFRNAPAGLKERYFHRTADGSYAIVPEIRKLVSFAYLNLVEDAYPSLATNINAMDLILCRNVLMYFTPDQSRKVVDNLHRALVEGGSLVVSASESPQLSLSAFTRVQLPGAAVYRKRPLRDQPQAVRVLPKAAPAATARGVPALLAPMIDAPQPEGTARDKPQPDEAARAREALEALYDQGQYAEAAAGLRVLAEGSRDPAVFSLLTRALANHGSLTDALAWCDRWVTLDKLNAAAHYVRAVVLLEQGDRDAARASLQRAIYLEPAFVLAHFALGNLAHLRDRPDEAERCFANAGSLLQGLAPGDPLPHSDGITAGRLAEIISGTTAIRGAA